MAALSWLVVLRLVWLRGEIPKGQLQVFERIAFLVRVEQGVASFDGACSEIGTVQINRHRTSAGECGRKAGFPAARAAVRSDRAAARWSPLTHCIDRCCHWPRLAGATRPMTPTPGAPLMATSESSTAAAVCPAVRIKSPPRRLKRATLFRTMRSPDCTQPSGRVRSGHRCRRPGDRRHPRCRTAHRYRHRPSRQPRCRRLWPGGHPMTRNQFPACPSHRHRKNDRRRLRPTTVDYKVLVACATVGPIDPRAHPASLKYWRFVSS